MILKLLTKFYNICTIGHSPTHISSPIYCRHTVSANMGGSPQRIFYIEHTIWMALTAIHKNTLKQTNKRTLYRLIFSDQGTNNIE